MPGTTLVCDLRLRTLSRALIATLALTAAAVAGSNPDEPVAAPKPAAYTLRYKFHSGQIIHLAVEHHKTLAARHSQGEEVTRDRSVEHKHYRVVSVDDEGVATLESTLERVQMTAVVDDSGPQSVDSRDPEGCPAPYRRVLAMIGKPLARFRAKPDGTILSVEPLVGTRPESSATTPPAATDEDFNGNVFVTFPDRPLKPGDTWHEDFEVPITLTGRLRHNVALRRKFTLQAVDGDIARIQMKTALLTAVRDPRLMVQLILRTPESTIDFDMQRGVIVRRATLCDETVIGAWGAGSSLHATSRRTERLLEPSEFARQVAADPRPDAPSAN